ncbi:MAG: InlB B-repeat-containing protein [Paludibacteraceae bacterium]|nr:InlB B-repeat-containing protein [Paludibacteraceae bacterium]
MRNKLTKFLTSECPPKGMRQFAKTWKYAACMLLAFILGIGQMWANQTELISGKTLPDIPSASLNVATQSTFTADANGWIVFDPYAEVANLSTVPSWWGHTAKATQEQAFASADLETLSPTAPFVAKSTNHFRINTGNAAAIRFTGAEAISVLVHPRSSSSGKEICATLFSYDSGATPAQVKVGDEKKTSSQTFHEFLFNGLTTSSTYVLYVYNNGTSQNGCLAEVAIKKHVNVTGPFAISYDKNDEGASGTMTDASSPYAKDATVTVLANSFTAPTGKVFVGWNTKANGTGASYNPDDTFSATADVTLFAQWAYPATGTGTITYTLTKAAATVSAAVSGVSTLSSSSTAFSVSTLAIGSSNSKDGYSGQITGHAADYSASQYVALQFTVADGYTFTPSAVNMKVFANSTSNMKMKLVFTDGVTSVESEELACASSADSDIEFASGAFTGKKFVGNVDVVLYQWGVTSKRTYVKSPVTITGTVAAAVPVTNYTVTIDPNGGSYASTPDGWTYDDVADKYTTSIASGTSFTAPAGLAKGTDDLTWKDGSDNDVTFPVSITGDITFVAQWAPHTASNNANLSALEVAGCTLNETFDAATTAYTIDLPFYGTMPAVGDVTATKDDANAAAPEVSISGNVITVHCVAENGTSIKDYTITVNIAAAPAASTSVNIEQNILDNWKTWDFATALAAAHITISGTNGLDSLNDDPGKKNRNYGFLGLKFNKKQDIITIVVPAEKVLNVKFGQVGDVINVSANGVAQATVAKKTDGTSTVYHLDAAAVVREVIFTTTATATSTLQQVKIGEDVDPITLPWRVTYDAGDGTKGTCEKANEVWKGTALTLPVVTPESGWNFDGWNDGTTDYAAGDSYTPTANVTLTAQYSAIASGTDLDALTYQIGTGAATAVGYTTGTHEYTVKLPYAGSYDAITVAATPVSGASIVDDATKVLTVSTLPADATFTVTDGVNNQLYTVHFVMSPKDGVEIIGVVTTGGTNKTVSGLYKGDASVNLDSNKKIGGDKYIYVTLASGYTFEETDVLVVDVEAKSDLSGGNKALEITTGVGNIDGSVWKSIAFEDYTTGENIIPLTGIAANQTSIGLKRSSNQNAFINGLKVYRPMNPVLTAITINDRDGVIDPLDDKHFTVTIPNDANLASLTIVPTIVRNAPHATTPEQVMTNSGAWVLTEDGNNTYRIMDKDGDYTDYTITLIRDVLKYQVSFDTDGGSSIDPVEVVANGYLTAGQVPADPTKTENVFLGWAETAGGDVVADITAIQITDDKTFFAKWEAEPDGIKLFSNTGELNTAKFITPAKADDPIVIDAVPYPTLVAFGSNRTSLGGAKQADVVLYSATTNQTKIKFQLYNTNSSAKKAYLWMVEEGATESGDPIEIEVDGETMVTTGYYTFNSNKNRSFYLTSGSKADIKVLQAKVIESGTDIHQFGQAGYELNFNKGRIAVAASATVQFEGASIHSNEDYSVLNSSNFKPKTYIQFNNAVANTIVKITKSSSNKYYVTNDLDNKGEGYSTDAEVELTTTGTWYIGSVNSGSVAALSKIEFIAPKCAEPEFNALANSDICEGDPYVALDGTATITDAGTVTYKWYAEGADESDPAAVLGTDATYTPSVDGKYYVIATNSLSGYSDNVKKSDLVSVTHFASAAITTAPANQRKEAGQNATLTVAATGKAPLTYQWYTCDENGDNAVLIDGAEAETYQVEVTAAMHQYYKVVVGSGCGSAEAVALVEEWHEVTPANVTGSRTWDWAAESMGEIATESGSVEYLMANVSSQIPNTEAFRSDMLYITANYANRSSSNKFFQGWQIRFYTEVPGKVSLNCRAIHGTMSITINGTVIDDAKGSDMGTATTPFFVPAGWVTIVFDNQSSGYVGEAARVQKIVFNATPDYTRTEMLGNGVYGTICVDHNVPEGGVRGVTVYEIAGREPQYGKIAFDEVTEMEAGVPYVFIAHGNEMALYYGETHVDDPINGNGMYGTFTAQTLTDLDGIYYFAKSALWSCVDLTSLNLPANRAYVKLSEIDYLSDPNPAPGRKRILLGVNGQNAATDVDLLNAAEAPVKMIINGQLFILRGEKLYDATGRMVK